MSTEGYAEGPAAADKQAFEASWREITFHASRGGAWVDMPFGLPHYGNDYTFRKSLCRFFFDLGRSSQRDQAVPVAGDGAPLLVTCIEEVEGWRSSAGLPAEVYVALGVVLDVAREAARGEGQ